MVRKLTVRDDVIEKIAKGCFGVDLTLTPTLRKVSVSVVDLKAALQAAYKYGQEDPNPTKT